jgi:hypothetical protein
MEMVRDVLDIASRTRWGWPRWSCAGIASADWRQADPDTVDTTTSDR